MAGIGRVGTAQPYHGVDKCYLRATRGVASMSTLPAVFYIQPWSSVVAPFNPGRARGRSKGTPVCCGPGYGIKIWWVGIGMGVMAMSGICVRF